MVSPRQLAAGLLLLAIHPGLVGQAQEGGLGRPVDESALQGFDLVVMPDGDGLPAGSGTANEGRELFNTRCAACHGMNGEGTSGNTILVGGDMQSEESPLRTVGSYWPHVSTLFDFVRRAMPADAPKTLSDDEVYKLVAYVLFLNGLVEAEQRLDSESLLDVAMPNADGFSDRSHIQ